MEGFQPRTIVVGLFRLLNSLQPSAIAVSLVTSEIFFCLSLPFNLLQHHHGFYAVVSSSSACCSASSWCWNLQSLPTLRRSPMVRIQPPFFLLSVVELWFCDFPPSSSMRAAVPSCSLVFQLPSPGLDFAFFIPLLLCPRVPSPISLLPPTARHP